MNSHQGRFARTSLEAFPTRYPEAFEGHQPHKERFVYVLIRWLSIAILIGLPTCIYFGVI